MACRAFLFPSLNAQEAQVCRWSKILPRLVAAHKLFVVKDGTKKKAFVGY